MLALRLFCLSFLAALPLLTAPVASAQIIDEARFGGTWAQPDWLDNNHPEADQFGINGEILFTPFDWDRRDNPRDDFLHVLATPRFHIGGMVNFDDNGTDYIYAGLTWQYRFNPIFFAEFGFGAGLNNGEDAATPTRAGLGSALTFRESFALGANLTENVTAVFQVEHLSHADLADDTFNRGLSNASLKLGIKF